MTLQFLIVVLQLVAAIMTALCIACGEDTNPKHRVNFQQGFYRTTTTKDPGAKSFYGASSGRENQKEYSRYAYIQNKFNNNIVINANVLLTLAII